jgi:outer membrane receptor protein involved in Fe transport
VDDLADVLSLQPGVVIQADELHVRGGRSGETVTQLDGMSLSEPLRRRAMQVPLLALSRAELVSGAPDARYGGGLAGVLDLQTVNPGDRPSAEWRWQSDAGSSTHYDRIAARAGSPLRRLGLGVVAAGEVMLDDTALPSLRSSSHAEIAGVPLGWRAENHVLGFLKIAPIGAAERFSAQVLMSRSMHRPFDPGWTKDGWVYLTENNKDSPVFSDTPQPGYMRYIAADHLDVTDERELAAQVKVHALRPGRRASLSLGWQRVRTVTSMTGQREPAYVVHRPLYGRPGNTDQFYVLWGDDPYYLESGSDVFSLRGDTKVEMHGGGDVGGGFGLTYEDVSLREMDWMSGWVRSFNWEGAPPIDSIRSYQAYAPGGFAYLQTHWLNGGMVLNAGLRAEYFTPGPQADRQTLPGDDRGRWSFGPRLGIAYPISVRDAFSLAYVRIQEAPARDYLYDSRTAITDRQPLGNPALESATLISYEAALKHLFSPTWAAQASVFYRDVYGQTAALDYQIPQGTTNLRYENGDQSHVAGFEWSLVHSAGRRRIEAHYTWMDARGNESRPEGDPYGPVRGASIPPISDAPLSWDRRHTVAMSGVWPLRSDVLLSWSSALGSPLPWTPKTRRQAFTDLEQVNSERLSWSEATHLDLVWAPPQARGMMLGFEVRNLFDHRTELAATVDGYPNPVINTLYDDYGAYRTETGQGGGAYWSHVINETDHWVPVHDPRLFQSPRTVRMSVGARW